MMRPIFFSTIIVFCHLDISRSSATCLRYHSVPLSPLPHTIRSSGLHPFPKRYELTLDVILQRAEIKTDRIVDDMLVGVGQPFQKKTFTVLERAKAERLCPLTELNEYHRMLNTILDNILFWAIAKIVAAADNPLLLLPRRFLFMYAPLVPAWMPHSMPFVLVPPPVDTFLSVIGLTVSYLLL